jgi:pilus assembly protein Flp/PilA
MNQLLRFLRDKSGATVIEYGLIASGIALALVTALHSLSDKFNTMFGLIIAAMK